MNVDHFQRACAIVIEQQEITQEHPLLMVAAGQVGEAINQAFTCARDGTGMKEAVGMPVVAAIETLMAAAHVLGVNVETYHLVRQARRAC